MLGRILKPDFFSLLPLSINTHTLTHRHSSPVLSQLYEAGRQAEASRIAQGMKAVKPRRQCLKKPVRKVSAFTLM